MGVELARAYLTVRADASALPHDFENIKQMATTQMSALAGVAAGLLAPVALLGRNLLSAGVESAGSFEQTRVEMETLLGSVEETKKTLDDLTKFARDTPFEMPQLLSASTQLITFGERGDQMMSTLKMLGDASMGSSEKFGLLSVVFNQIRGVGKLLTQDFRQLSTRGIISLKDIAQHFGVTDAAASKMLSNGQISFEQFRQILAGLTSEGGRFADGMLKQSTTFVGLKSTFNDAIGITQRLIAQPLLPFFKGVLSHGLIPLVSTLGDLVQTGGEYVSFAVVGATSTAALTAGLYGAGIAAKFFGTSLTRALLVGFPLAGVVLAVGAGLGALASYYKVPERIGEGFAWLKKQIADGSPVVTNLQNAWLRLKDTAGIVGTALWDAVRPFVGGAGAWMASFTGAVFSGLTSAINWVSQFALETSEWLQAVATNWRQVWDNFPKVAAFAWSFINDIVRNGMVLMVQTVAGNVGKMIDNFYALQTHMKIAAADAKQQIMGGGKLTDQQIQAFVQQGQMFSLGMKQKLGLNADGAFTGGLFDMSPQTRKMADSLKESLKGVFKTKKELEDKRKPSGSKPAEPDTPTGGKALSGPPPLQADPLKAGVYEISAFGKRLQESMFSKTDHGAAQVDLLTGIKQVQEKQLKATVDLSGSGGLADDN